MIRAVKLDRRTLPRGIQFPDGADRPVQYGPNVKAHAVYLSQYRLLMQWPYLLEWLARMTSDYSQTAATSWGFTF